MQLFIINIMSKKIHLLCDEFKMIQLITNLRELSDMYGHEHWGDCFFDGGSDSLLR